MAAVLAFCAWKFWNRLAEKDAEIARLNEARVKDLLEVAHRDD